MQGAMRPIYNSILFFSLLAIYCKAYPPSASRDHYFSGNIETHEHPRLVSFCLELELNEAWGKRSLQLLVRHGSWETNAEKLAEIIAKQDEFEPDNWNVDQRKEYPDAVNGLRITDDRNGLSFLNNEIEDRMNNDKTENPFSDYEIDKRGISKGRYNYYRCYFNPVTCYRK